MCVCVCVWTRLGGAWTSNISKGWYDLSILAISITTLSWSTRYHPLAAVILQDLALFRRAALDQISYFGITCCLLHQRQYLVHIKTTKRSVYSSKSTKDKSCCLRVRDEYFVLALILAYGIVSAEALTFADVCAGRITRMILMERYELGDLQERTLHIRRNKELCVPMDSLVAGTLRRCCTNKIASGYVCKQINTFYHAVVMLYRLGRDLKPSPRI